jgi:hypothetical protein
MAKQSAQSIAIGAGPISHRVSRYHAFGDEIGQPQRCRDPDRHRCNKVAE